MIAPEISGLIELANIPSYLSPKDKDALWTEIKNFPDNKAYYLNHASFAGEVLQGDLVADIKILNYDTGEGKPVRGVVLSNSCDIDNKNPRNFPVKVTFAPIVSLKKMEDVLLGGGKDKVSAASVIDAIRSQLSSNFFYLPSCPGVIEESAVVLSDVHSIPSKHFFDKNKKALTLSQYGFYLFIIKLSIHFCRFQEGVNRTD